MKVETYTDRAGRDWDLHRIPQHVDDPIWLARRAEGDPNGDEDKEGGTRAEVVHAVENAALIPAPALEEIP